MRRFIVLIALVAALPLAACGGSMHDVMGHDDGAMTHDDAQMGTGRQADVMFTQEMIPHHQQAVEMADLALDPVHAASPEVRDLAGRIKRAQSAEIADMRAWLAEWGADPAESGHMDHMGDSGMGMMSADAMEVLNGAKGAAFDRLWLEGMIQHHEGALMMADHIAERGDDPRVAKLSRAIDTSQTAEIAEMKQLLGQ